MSSTDEIILPKRHRHTRSAVTVPPRTTPSQQHPQNPHHLNVQAHTQNNQSEMNYPAQPSTPPRTPRRDNRSGPQNPSPNPNESAARHKNKNKNRPKDVITSPAVKVNGRQTPPETAAPGMPLSSKPVNTPSTAVYAGATFHASPAPSSLPIPSFFSKSVPESPGLKALKSAPLSKQNDSPPPLPNPTAANQFQRQESPLDLFFRADREEKARARSASSANTTGATAGPFPPPVSPRNAQTPPAPSSLNRSHPGHQSKSSVGGIFAMEMESPSPSTQYGPAFSTPYSERINAARADKPLGRQKSQESTDRSEALKAYLFSGHISSPPPTTNSNPANGYPSPSTPLNSNSTASSQQTGPRFSNDITASTIGARASGRASGLRQEMTPTKTPTRTPDRSIFYQNSPTPSQTYGNTSNSNNLSAKFKAHSASPASSCGVSSSKGGADLQGMEDSLRKVLKLDAAGSSSATNPASTTSMPNYARGRI